MANSDKDILITPNTGASAEPTIEFTGKDNTPITLRVLDDGTVSFEGTAGQLFSVADGLSGTIFSVNDISGIPSIEVLDNGTVRLAEYNGGVAIGKSSASTTLDVDGTVTATLFAGSGSALTNINWSSVDNKPDPTITLGGDASGSLTLTDLAGGTLTVTVSDDSHNHIISNIDGLQTALNSKLDSSSYTASDVLTKIKTVDGDASGLDSDLLDGQHGSYYLDWTNITNKPDPTITLLGDATGSATFTNLGSASVTVTVADDSHNHVISNVDGLQTALDGKQASDADLTAIAALSGTSGFLKKTAANTWSLDTNTYLTGNQTITLSGDVSGSGTTAITVTVADDSHNHVISNVDGLQTALNAKAPLASPTFTGTPAAPTASAATNTTQIATTAFVQTAVSNLVDSAPGTLDTLNELAAALGDDPNFATTVTNSIAGKQPLDADLTAIAGLSGTSGFLKKTAANTWSLDTNTYLTGNQTITLSGDVSGSGTTAITVTVADDSHNHIISNVDGLQTALDAKLDSSSYTASDVLTKIKTVDGSTSGLDADLLDGQQASSFASLSGATFTGNVTGVSPTAAGSWGYRRITMSTSAPSGGLDGDVWLVYT